jgi:hypothetical protein
LREELTLPKTGSRPKTAARRAPARKSPELPILPIVVGGVFLVILIGLFIASRIGSGSGGVTGQPVANISCDTGEQLATHYHAHVDILYKGQPVPVAAQIGIPGTCFYWMHTHDTTGVIHIEAPKAQASRQFTLGEFFKVWGQPLSSTQVATLKLAPGDQMKIWVNNQPYTGDPSKIVLRSHEQIVIDIGPPIVDTPPTFTWDPAQYSQ